MNNYELLVKFTLFVRDNYRQDRLNRYYRIGSIASPSDGYALSDIIQQFLRTITK